MMASWRCPWSESRNVRLSLLCKKASRSTVFLILQVFVLQLLPQATFKTGTLCPLYDFSRYLVLATLMKVAIIINLPGGVAIENSGDFSLMLQNNATELVLWIWMTQFFRDFEFVEKMMFYPEYKDELMSFKLHLECSQVNMWATRNDDFFYRAVIPLGVSVIPVIGEHDWNIINAGAYYEIRCLIVTLALPNDVTTTPSLLLSRGSDASLSYPRVVRSFNGYIKPFFSTLVDARLYVTNIHIMYLANIIEIKGQ